MATKTFTTGEVLTASDTNSYLANSGLVYIGGGSFSGTTNNVTSIFSATYDSYRIVLNNMTIGASGYFSFRMLAGTTPLATGTYYSSARGFNSNGTALDLSAAGASVGYMQQSFSAAATNAGSVAMDIINPFATTVTFFQTQASNFATSAYTTYSGSIAIDNATSYDGLQFLQNAGATTVGATYRVYGYRQA
jgi:hypothetical protein